MSAEAIAKRELEGTYNTPELRAAYRAGLSTAMAICDERADAYKRIKLTRASRAYSSSAAKACGNDIEAMWKSVEVPNA